MKKKFKIIVPIILRDLDHVFVLFCVYGGVVSCDSLSSCFSDTFHMQGAWAGQSWGQHVYLCVCNVDQGWVLQGVKGNRAGQVKRLRG